MASLVATQHSFGANSQKSLLGGRKSRLDDLILTSSISLAKCSLAAIDKVINSTLRELCKVEDADHAGWSFIREQPNTMGYFASDPVDRILDRVRQLDQNDLPWCRSRLLKGHVVLLADLSALPFQAMTDREYLQNSGLRSLALIPTDASDPTRGVLVLLSRRPSSWSSNLGRQGALLGSVFLGAHARKLAYEERENSDSNIRNILCSASAGMALEDASGTLLFVNEALCTMLGYTELELIQMKCVDFSHPADYEREALLFSQLFSGERRSYQIEKRFLHRNGTTVWGRINVTLLRQSSNGSRLILAIVEDITSQKHAMEKLAASKMEIQSLASRLIQSQEDERRRIARELHDDIGQRLSMVTSEVHILEKRPLGDRRRSLTPLKRLGGELDTLVSDLQELSHRLHSSKLQHLGIKWALRELCEQLAHSGLRVDLSVDEKLEPIPKETALCLYRVAQEALNNALKHSGANRATMTLSGVIAGYRMIIKDAGKGFDVELASEGLGLISMKERLKVLQGVIAVTSAPGKGTEVVVLVPRLDYPTLEIRETMSAPSK